MGNVFSNNANKEGNIECTKKEFPCNINDFEWIPSIGLSSSKQNERIFSEEGDLRVRAKVSDYDCNDIKYDALEDECKSAIYNIVQLKSFFERNYGIGSGVIIHCTLNKAYVLTAAHNIVMKDDCDPDKILKANDIQICLNQNEEAANGHKELETYVCSRYHVHEKYIKYLQNKSIVESETGFDIAMVEVLDPDNKLRKIKKIKMCRVDTTSMDDIKIKVIGFPGFLGQKDKRGELYGMAGDGKMDYTHKKTKMNKLITYKNIDTTGGQSGCPIFKDEEKSSEQDLYNSLNEIIGIHTAGKMSTGLNFGTPLNGELMQWIHEYIGCQNRKYDTYDIGVLLITSSQSKYADRLNNIYNTCLRTEIMDITRVYYEKDDNDIDTKKHFFSYVQQFFKEKKQKYLIFYCGESDDDGNWMINSNENDN
eukprot:237481_1